MTANIGNAKITKKRKKPQKVHSHDSGVELDEEVEKKNELKEKSVDHTVI